MNKRQIIASLNNIADVLDNSGLCKEANTITNVMKRVAMPLSTEDTAKAHQEMSNIMQSINRTTSVFEKELSDFNRLLRFMEESFNNRRSDPEEILMLKRKLNQKLLEINDLRIKLSNDIQEMSRVSGIVQQRLNNAPEMGEPTTQESKLTLPQAPIGSLRNRFEN